MARLEEALPENAPGDYFVDRTCIDCDLCQQLAPGVFARSSREGQSFVTAQPGDARERTRAAMALVTCPTSSIGTRSKADVAAGVEALPERIDGEVYFCGYASESSYGASSYFVRRPSSSGRGGAIVGSRTPGEGLGGNLLVDSPRAAAPLLKKLDALGGVGTLFLTHRDDVADHAKLRERYACQRVLHRADVSSGTRDVEVQPEGQDPVQLAPDLLMIPVPGHTRGSAVLLYAGRYLFTGDHLWADEDDESRLSAGRGVAWYSWREQARSMERLLDYEFEWVLPGHGRRFRADSPAAMRRELERVVAWMKRTA